MPLGSWVSTAQFGAYPDLIRLEIDSDTALYGKIYYENIDFQRVIDLQYKNKNLTFKIVDLKKERVFSFDLQHKKDTLKGIFRMDNQTYLVTFIKIVQLSLPKLEEYVGFYKTETDQIIEVSIFPTDNFVFNLSVLNFSTGKKHIVFPTNDSTFIAGKKNLQIYPIYQTFCFFKENDENQYKLMIKDLSSAQYAKRLKDIVKEDIIFSIAKENIDIHGTLSYPDTVGTYPLVVFVPDAGWQARNNILDDYMRLLPHKGLATLIYDKRGCFKSGGNYKTTDLTTFAKDAIFIIEKLKQHPNIKANKVALLGVGQGGVLNALIGKMYPTISCIVNISTVAHTLEEQDYEIIRSYMTLEGYNNSTINKALSYQKKAFSYLKGFITEDNFEKYATEVTNTEWEKYLILPYKTELIDWWKKHYNLKVQDYWKTLEIPILSLYGENDLTLNAEKNKILMQKITKSKYSQVKYYEKVDHFLLKGKRKGDLQYTEIDGYPENLFYFIADWLKKFIK